MNYNFKLFKLGFFYRNYIDPIWNLFKQCNIPNNKIGLILILTLTVSFFEGLFIWLLAPFTNSVLNKEQISSNDFGIVSQVYNSPFGLLLLIIIALSAKSYIITFTTYYVTKITFIIRKKLRIKIIESVLDTSWKTKLKGGTLLDAYINASSIASGTILILTEILINAFYVIGILIIFLFRVSPDMIIVFSLLGFFYYVVIYFLSKSAKNLSFSILKTDQKVSQAATEIIRGSRELQIYGYGIQKILLNEIITEENKLVNNQSKSSLIRKIPSVLPSILITLVVVYGFFSKGTDNISTSSSLVVTALVAIQRLGSYLSVLGQKFTVIGSGTAQINFLLEEIKKKSFFKGKKLLISKIDKNIISINNLTFNYGNNTDLLKNINLDFDSSKVSVIVGPSGSGKSSFFSLLLKECDPLKGEILVNGVSLNKISKNDWYQKLSLVSQSPFIFGTSIIDNIKIGKSNATENEVLRASKTSGAFQFIDKLSNKFEFNVLDGGTNLSGGQCQLISLTRAILKNAPIVLLDEPTNNLDKKAVENLKDLLLIWAKKNKLVLVITHDQRLIDERFDIYKVKDFNLFRQLNS